MLNRLKGIIYDCILLLACMGGRKRHSRKLLIVRIDEIGDYMLWHRFLKEIIQSEKFAGYEIHFCGNKSWKTLFDTFDKEGISQDFWIDKIRFKKEIGYRYQFLKKVYKEGYEVLINPAFSRDKRNDDSIVLAAKAVENFGMEANKESVRSYEEGYDTRLYTKLFSYKEKPIFEFYRNRLFTEFLTGTVSDIVTTKIDKQLLPVLNIDLPEKYFVVFPGSRSSARIWPAENFIRVSNYLYEQYGFTAVVCGTAGDAGYTEAFLEQYPNPVLNLTGKTSLTEMLSLLAEAECLLSVDTGSVHLAAAVGCTVFGIFNGSQYGRFAPYPQDLADNFYSIYPDEVEAELENSNLVKEKYEFVVPIPYHLVKPEKLILAVHRHFSK